MSRAKFAIATPGHSPIIDNDALALEKHDLLRFVARGTRRGITSLPPEYMRRYPVFGLLTYATAKTMSVFAAESFRFRMHPFFDKFVKRQLVPGDHMISSYGYTNECFAWIQKHGGKTFLDGGNSHPENFWTILSEEQRRWDSPYPPVAHHHYKRAVAMMEHVDYVLSPSSFVTKSFTDRGFKPERIFPHRTPINLSAFRPADTPRPRNRPLTLICTGTLCLRKGSPYLFESFRLIQKKFPNFQILLRDIVANDFKPILAQYRDLPIKWLPLMPHHELAVHLREADIFILPSLEDGLALTILEALACGLPVITTPNTGASELIVPGVSGSVVPIRDPQAIANAVFEWADRIMTTDEPPKRLLDAEAFSFEPFARLFIEQLRSLGIT